MSAIAPYLSAVQTTFVHWSTPEYSCGLREGQFMKDAVSPEQMEALALDWQRVHGDA